MLRPAPWPGSKAAPILSQCVACSRWEYARVLLRMARLYQSCLLWLGLGWADSAQRERHTLSPVRINAMVIPFIQPEFSG